MSTPDIYKNRYPIYILSKGRSDSCITMKALDLLGVPYRVAVEEHEVSKYAAVLGKEKIIALPFSNHSMGGGPARNYIWEHSIAEGHERHWILDDNLREFWRFNDNQHGCVGYH